MNNNDSMRLVYLRRRIIGLIVLLWIVFFIIWAITSIVSCASSTGDSTEQSSGSTNEPEKPPLGYTDLPKPSLQIICEDSPEMLVGTAKLGIVSKCGDDDFHLIASITKTLTSLVVLDDVGNSLDALAARTFVFDDADIARTQRDESVGGTTLPIVTGQEIDEGTALTGMMLASANNVADSLAIHHFGSFENYKEAAQKYVDSHGLHDYVKLGDDASGLDDKTYFRPSGVFAMGQIVASVPALMQVVALDSTMWPDPYLGYDVGVANVIVGLHRVGFNGMKNGYTGAAGRTILGSKPASKIDDLIIVVALGDTNDANGFSHMDAQKVAAELDAVLTVPTQQAE